MPHQIRARSSDPLRASPWQRSYSTPRPRDDTVSKVARRALTDLNVNNSRQIKLVTPPASHEQFSTPERAWPVAPPALYHSADFVDQQLDENSNPKKWLKGTMKHRERLPCTTVQVGSAKKDNPCNKQPTPNGEIWVTPEHASSGKRLYLVHRDPGAMNKRLISYPVAGPNLLPIKGSDYNLLVEEFRNNHCQGSPGTFEDHLRVRVERPPTCRRLDFREFDIETARIGS
jgi:hypothetical protein